MRRDTGDHRGDAAERPAGPPTSRAIAQGEGWCVSEYTCRSGPWDRPYEERHEHVTIAAVIGGSFQYRSDAGDALLYPGSFLLGNAGTGFECGHEHSTGDRCISFHFAPAFFGEIAAEVTGSHRFRFPTAMLPAIRELTLPVVEIETMAKGQSRMAVDELATGLAETVLASLGGTGGRSAAPSAKDQRRISTVLRHIEDHAEEPLSLAGLADVAAMSKYHFLRTFRRTVGITPYEFLLGTRMRRAAIRLCTTRIPVATIAFDAGFGDLSTFNGRFRDVFGVPPRDYRSRNPN